MADARLRQLERAAASGDPEAIECYEQFKKKTEKKELSNFEKMAEILAGMSFSIQDLANEFSTLTWQTLTTSAAFEERLADVRDLFPAPDQVTQRFYRMQKVDLVIPKAREPPGD